MGDNFISWNNTLKLYFSLETPGYLGTYRRLTPWLLIVQSLCGHFSDNLKIIATEGFLLQNVSLVSLEWHIKTLLR